MIKIRKGESEVQTFQCDNTMYDKLSVSSKKPNLYSVLLIDISSYLSTLKENEKNGIINRNSYVFSIFINSNVNAGTISISNPYLIKNRNCRNNSYDYLTEYKEEEKIEGEETPYLKVSSREGYLPLFLEEETTIKLFGYKDFYVWSSLTNSENNISIDTSKSEALNIYLKSNEGADIIELNNITVFNDPPNYLVVDKYSWNDFSTILYDIHNGYQYLRNNYDKNSHGKDYLVFEIYCSENFF